MTRRLILAALAVSILPFISACGGPSGPPHVVSTTPALNASVPASTATITVTYDRPMAATSSFVQMMTATMPLRTGEPTQSADHKTFTLPVRLQPNTDYTVGLNSLNFHEFKDVQGTPATPFVLTFHTGG